jgi:hypothetical protein
LKSAAAVPAFFRLVATDDIRRWSSTFESCPCLRAEMDIIEPVIEPIGRTESSSQSGLSKRLAFGSLRFRDVLRRHDILWLDSPTAS